MTYPTRITEWLFYFLPFLLITGPFLPELVVISIFFLSFIFLKKIKINFLITLLIGLNILILIQSLFVYKNYNFENLKFIFFFRFIIFAIAISYILSFKKNIIRNLNIILISIFLILFLDSCLQYLSGQNILGFRNETHYRVSSFFGDEYILGSFTGRMMPIVISTAYFVFNNKPIKRDYIILCILFLGFIICIISGDRSSLIFPFSLTFIFLLINFKKKKVEIFVFFIFILGILLTTNTIKQRIIKTSINEFINNDKVIYFSPAHHNYAIVSLNMFKEKKFFGHGFKTFRKMCDKKEFQNNTLEDYKKCNTHPHNYYLQFLSENGFFNFIILLIIFIYSIIKILNFIFIDFNKRDKKNNALIFAYSGISISLFPLIPNGNFFNGWLLVIFFIYVSLINFYEKYQA